MSAKDAKARAYLSDSKRFADLFNYYLFKGKQVIRPEDLVEKDTAEVLSLYGLNDKEILKQRWRDILKSAIIKASKHGVFVLLGIENQSDIHYAMPVRNLTYDAMEYVSQVSEATKKHREDKDYGSNEEFLSGFRKKDKLIPVITLTVYWGAKAWDAPRSLHDMMDKRYAELLPYINDYKLNLIVPSEIENFDLFKTRVREVLEFIKVSEDKEKVDELIKSRKQYKKMDYEDVSAIETFTGIKLVRAKKKGEIDMCKAWEDRLQQGVEQGIEQGEEIKLIEQVCKKMKKNKTPDEIADALEEDYAKITEIYDEVLAQGSTYDVRKIYESLSAKKVYA